MNLSFLSPLFLIGLAAIALPVIAHLISKKSGAKKSFPSLRFLISSQGDLAARSRIKDIILLLLRALILVLIVLVFAKPAVFSFSSAGDNTPKSLAIVIDNSFSMGYAGNFSRALSKARDLIDTLPDGSSAFVASLVPDDNLSPELIQDKSQLKQALKTITLSNTFTDNAIRLEEIYNKLQIGHNERKVVTLITDLQKNGWNNDLFQRPWLEVIDISKDQEPSNHAVSNVQIKDVKNSISIEAEVSNFSSVPAKELLLRALFGTQAIRESIDIAPDSKSIKKFQFSAEKEAPGNGSAVSSHDKLEIDDTRYFIMNTQEQFKILIVDGDSREDARLSETYYLARALETISELSDSNISIIDNDSFLDENLSEYELIMLANVGEITPRTAKDLEEFTNSGGTTVIFTGDRIRPDYYNILLGNILPGKLQNIEERRLSLLPEDSGAFSQDINDKMEQVIIEKFFNIEPHGDSKTLLSASNNKPFLVKKDYGKGSVFIFTSTADSGWSNFSITPVFLPVIKQVHDYPYYEKSKRRSYLVGESVSIDISPDADSAAVTDPAEQRFKLDIDTNEFDRTGLPGIYIVELGGETAYEFAVNIDPRESDLKKILIPKIESSKQSSDLVKVFKEIWRYFLWGAIALFVSEAAFRAMFS